MIGFFVLEAKRITGFGNVGFTKNGSHGMVSWGVTCFKDLELLITFFRRFRLRSKKSRDFEIRASAFEWYRDQRLSLPRESGRTGGRYRYRAALVKHQPLLSSSRQRFKKVPEHVFAEMEKRSLLLKAVRVFKMVS